MQDRGVAGYTKLFNSILASTIWREDDKTRIVWITLLALSNKNGIAETSIPGLADLARVSVPDCEMALKKLMAPDSYSRTKDHDGRRIEPCDEGFVLLNHAKYRAKMSADERREYNRVKQAEHRQKVSTNVNEGQLQSALSLHSDSEAAPEANAEAIYKAYPLKVGKPKAIESIKRAMRKFAPNMILERTERYAVVAANIDRQFIPNPTTWYNQQRFNDDESTWARTSKNGANDALQRKQERASREYPSNVNVQHLVRKA